MKLVSIDEFVNGLVRIPETQFTAGAVYDYVIARNVDEASLQPYLFFSKKHYTRNLIFKNKLFELLALCWDIGHVSNIHNHWDQSCWMTVPFGRLRVQNFRVLEEDRRIGYCHLETADSFDIHPTTPTEVDSAEPVHQVLNLPEFNERAVSLHIYSRPYDRCVVYSPAKNTYHEVVLRYTSKYGKLCLGERI